MTVELDLVDIKRVITKDGKDIGVVSACNLDASSWMVTSLVIKLKKTAIDELKVKKKLFQHIYITLRTNQIANMADVVQLNIDLAELKKQLAL
jgi:sporulation protein YlmC with PRC-barrel domain